MKIKRRKVLFHWDLWGSCSICEIKWRSSHSGGNCQTKGIWSSTLGNNSKTQTPSVWSTRMPQTDRQKSKTHVIPFIPHDFYNHLREYQEFSFLCLQVRHLCWLSFLISHCVCVLVAQSCPTLQPHRLGLTRLLYPQDSPGKNTGIGCHSLWDHNPLWYSCLATWEFSTQIPHRHYDVYMPKLLP